jgi:hypothetical protein
MPPRGVKKSSEIEQILSKQKKEGLPFPDLMANTVWISNI